MWGRRGLRRFSCCVKSCLLPPQQGREPSRGEEAVFLAVAACQIGLPIVLFILSANSVISVPEGFARWQIFHVTEKGHSREKRHPALCLLCNVWTNTILTPILYHPFPLWYLYCQKRWRLCEMGSTGQVEAEKPVSLATVAIPKAGKSSLSHFSFHCLWSLKEGQMLCVKFTLQFCWWYLLSQSWG